MKFMKKFITRRLKLSVAFVQAPPVVEGPENAYPDIAITSFFGVHNFLIASAIVLGGSSELFMTSSWG